MTLTEKVLARTSGQASVRAGDEVWAQVDRAIMNDSSGPRRIAALVEELGGLWDPARVVLVSDHFVPASNVRHAEILRTTRRWAADHRVDRFFEYQGILHNLVLERRLVGPGMLLLGADSHTTTAGAIGAVAIPVGSTELATVLATGQIWLRVPETVRIELHGRLPARVDIRDLTLRILGDHTTDLALYSAIEYGGPAAETLALDERLVLCNQGIEMGAKNAAVVPDRQLRDELAGGDDAAWQELWRHEVGPDPGAQYRTRLHYDLDGLRPLVGLHPSPARVAPAADVGQLAVDMAWLGSCAGGRRADLVAAASVLRGRRVRVPLLVTPATQAVFQACLADGTIATLAEAGATFLPPACGACAGIHAGVQGQGDVVIATATRNFPGRMGSREAQVHIGSAFTVAATALVGRIVDPREVDSRLC
jgi:3-isopropylmalate/(R)-2-methylmalate dehydratase large subunit